MDSSNSLAAKILTTPLILFGGTILMREVASGVLSVIPYGLSSATFFDDYFALTALMVLMMACLYFEIIMLNYCLSTQFALGLSCVQFGCTTLFLANEFFYLANYGLLVTFLIEVIGIVGVMWNNFKKHSVTYTRFETVIYAVFLLLSFGELVYFVSAL